MTASAVPMDRRQKSIVLLRIGPPFTMVVDPGGRDITIVLRCFFQPATLCQLQHAFITGRTAAGGNTFHEPSSWRKKKKDSRPSGRSASTRTQRRPEPAIRAQRMTRAGAAVLGASHLSTAQCKVFSVVFMMVSYARKIGCDVLRCYAARAAI